MALLVTTMADFPAGTKVSEVQQGDEEASGVPGAGVAVALMMRMDSGVVDGVTKLTIGLETQEAAQMIG